MFFGLSTKALSAIAAAVVLTGVVFGTAAVLADGDDFAPIQAPDWESGYAWTYDVSGEVGYTFTGDEIGAGSDGIDFGDLQIKKEILNTQDFSHRGEPLYLGATTLPIGHILDMDMFALDGGGWADLAVFPTADRHRDLAPIPAYPTFSSSTGEATGVAFADGLSVDYIQFPLEAGKRWSDTVSFAEELPGMDELDAFEDITELQLVGEVGGMETISVPIGSVDAVRIDFSYKPIGLQRAVAEFREEAESYGVVFERLNVQIGLHEIAHYSPAHEAIVRDQYIFKAIADVSAHVMGEHYEAFAEVTGYVLAEMSGSTLAELEEHDLPAILDKLNGREAIRDVEGTVLEEKDVYHIDLLASHDRVNSAEAQAVRFDIVNDAVGGLPAGHGYEYLVQDKHGQVTHFAGTGSQFNVVFDEPGVYTVRVAAVDPDGQAISQARQIVYADYVKTSEVTCGLSTLVTAPCGAVAVPARDGLERMVLTAKVNQTLLGDPLSQARIAFEDASGDVVYGYPSAPGEYRIELDNAYTSAKDGELSFRPLAGFGDVVAFTVDLSFNGEGLKLYEHQVSAGGLAMTGDWQFLGPMMGALDEALMDVASGEAMTLELDRLA